MKKSLIIGLILLGMLPQIEAQTYTLFHKNMREILYNIEVTDKKEIVIDKLKYPLVALDQKNIYVVNKGDSCSLIRFLYADKMLELFVDTSFVNIEGAREYASDTLNLSKHMAFYLIKDASISQLLNFPSEDSMSEEDRKALYDIEEETNRELISLGYDRIGPTLLFRYKAKKDRQTIMLMGAKMALKKQAMTYLMGYRPNK